MDRRPIEHLRRLTFRRDYAMAEVVYSQTVMKKHKKQRLIVVFCPNVIHAMLSSTLISVRCC